MQRLFVKEIGDDLTGSAHLYYLLTDAIGWTVPGPALPAEVSDLLGLWKSGNHPGEGREVILRQGGVFTLTLSDITGLTPSSIDGHWTYSDGTLELAPWLDIAGEGGRNPRVIDKESQELQARCRFGRGLRLEAFLPGYRGGLDFGRPD